MGKPVENSGIVGKVGEDKRRGRTVGKERV